MRRLRAIWNAAATTRNAFHNWIRIGVIAGIASPSAIPPRSGLDALASVRLRFRTRLGPVLETQAGNASPIIEIFRDGEYEIPVRWHALNTIVDVGGHVGSFTLWAAWQAPQARIVVLEPEPRNFADLSRNVDRNGLTDRVECIEAGLAPRSGSIELHVPVHRDNTSMFAAAGPSVAVAALSLGDVLERFTEPLDLLKLDCEGAEWEVLPSLSRKVWERLPTIVMECHATSEHSVDEMIDLLVANGYSIDVLERVPSGVAWYDEIATLFVTRAKQYGV